MPKRIDREKFETIVKKSKSKAQVIRELGGKGNEGGWYRTVNNYIRRWDIDISHFTGQGWNLGQKFDLTKFTKIPTKDILVKNSPYNNTSSLKKRLIKEKLLIYKCSECKNNGTWLGKKISLHLDHINGISNDNRIENLRILCPNCHAATPTYCNKKNKKDNSSDQLRNANNSLVSVPPKDKNWRKKPKPNQRKVDRPSKEKLVKELKASNFSAVGREYGVSDNAVRKWFKSYGLNKIDIK